MKIRDAILVVDFGTSNVRASLVAVRDGKIVKNAAALRSVKYIDGFFEPRVEIAERYANGYARYNALKVSLMGVS